MIVSKQHDVEEKIKDIDAYRHGLCWTIRDRKRLVDNRMDAGGPKCQHFSIRGYVARTRGVNGNICWPFPQHLLETRSKEEDNVALPPIEVPQYKWWNCRKCLDGTNTSSSESLVEKTNMKIFHDSLLACDGNSDPGRLMFGIILPTLNDDLQEKCRDNTLNHTKVAGCPTVDLKSKSVLSSSSCEAQKDKRDEMVVTEQTVEHCRNERIVSMDLQEEKYETGNATEEKIIMPQLSESEGKADMTAKHCHEKDRDKAHSDMRQSLLQSVSSILISKVDDELGSKVSTSDSFQNIHQSSNSWESFSRNKNIFEQISKKIRDKMKTQDTSQILSLGSQTCDVDHPGVDANKLENISTDPVSMSYDKIVQPGQQIQAEENSKESFTKKVIKPLTVQTMESNIKEKDCAVKALYEKNDVPCTNSIGSSGIVDRDSSNLSEGKECGDLPMDERALDTANVLLSKETEKLKVSESKSKRKSQKKRSLADIIASDSVLANCNKETEDSKSADIMEENTCRDEDHEQLPVEEDTTRVPKDAVKISTKSRVETSGISELNLNADINNVKHKKQRSENRKMKKKKIKGIQSLDAYSSVFSKVSSKSKKSEFVSNMIQMPQGASNLVQASRDKLFQDNSVHHVDGQIRQRCSQMEDDIPMDVVELMAKNQRERGISELQKKHKRKKEHRRVKIKVKESDVSHVNKPIQKEITGSKQKAAIHKNLAQPEKNNQVNPQVYLRTHFGSNTFGEDSQMHDSQMISLGHSSFSDMEAIKSGSLKDHSETLQSSQWLNPWGKYSNLIVPVFSGTNVACNPPASIVDGFSSKVTISQEGTFSTNGMSPSFLQVPRAAARDGEHMQRENLYGKDTNASLECRNPVFSGVHNNSEPSLHYTGVSPAIDSNQSHTKTVIPCLTGGNSDLDSGPKCNVPFQNHKGKGISVPSGKTDVVPFPAYFVGQSNSALLQQVNAQARPIFGSKHSVCVPAVPVLRLMGQSVSVPVNCGIGQNILSENKNNGTFSELLQASSQKHVTWFHPVTCASSGVSCEDTMYKISVPTQDSMCVKQQTQSSKTTIPPVPKFSPVCLVSNGQSGASSSSWTVPGKADVMESSIANKQFPFQGASVFVMQQKNGLHCTNGVYNGNLQTFSTIPPPTSQTTESVKGASPTKGPRSYRRPSNSVHLNRYHTAAVNMYCQKRHPHPQSSSISGTNPKQRKAEAAMKAKRFSRIKENKDSACLNKKSGNVDICTLNQNPAEIIIDDGENMDGFGYEHFASAPKAFSHSKRKGNLRVPNGEKRRRAFKTKYLQEFIGHENGHPSDLANTNVGKALLNN